MEYIPKPFQIEDRDKCLEIANHISFASIVYQSESQIEVSHNPVILSNDRNYLIGHFAKANPVWRSFESSLNQAKKTSEVLVTFQGEHALIDPSWYGTPNNVPTWNYIAIHIRGKIEIVDDSSELRFLLETMGNEYQLKNMEIPDQLMKAIVGFKISIDKVEGKAKLAQIKSILERQNVAKHLSENGHHQLAELMYDQGLPNALNK